MSTKQNAFILAQAAAHLVGAYKACIAEYQTVLPLDLRIGHDAPDNFNALKAQAAQGVLKVSTEHNATSIYGAAGNLPFRVFHDYGHLLYNAQFTTTDEILLANTQWQDLKKHLPTEWVSVCFAVYYADTVEQSKFEALNGYFPHNQRAFVLTHLENHFIKSI